MIYFTGFIQMLGSPEIKMLRFPGLESPGKQCFNDFTNPPDFSYWNIEDIVTLL